MDKFVIDGGRPLRGKVPISGSKNAALPILIATLLTDEDCRIHNVPDLRDIRTTFKLLERLGKSVVVQGRTVSVRARERLKTSAPYELVKQMRASVLVAGPLLARFGRARVPLPGGCAIGMRPVDIHLKGFQEMGARKGYEHGDILLKAKKLEPADVSLRFASVGATENLMMAAALVPGRTRILNAAREPEIEDLARFLVRMGAGVGGAGTSTLEVFGAPSLRGASHHVIADRIEAGTFLLAVAAAGGDARLDGARAEDLTALIEKLKAAGVKITATRGGLRVSMRSRPKAVSIATAPHPGFPTDLQAPWMSLMCLASGSSRIEESVFENRFLHAAELLRMGAQLRLDGNTARVTGRGELHGAPIMASDIRAGAALLIAALAAKGRSEIQRVYHIDRGYERVESKLRKLGARIRRLK